MHGALHFYLSGEYLWGGAGGAALRIDADATFVALGIVVDTIDAAIAQILIAGIGLPGIRGGGWG